MNILSGLGLGELNCDAQYETIGSYYTNMPLPHPGTDSYTSYEKAAFKYGTEVW